MTDGAAPAARRERSASESLLSITLMLEAVLVFFVTLVVFGLRALPAGIAFGGGAALLVVLLLDGRLVRYPWGVWLGWLLQAVLIAVGILVPMMYFIGAVFLAIWIYCFVTGRRLDAREAAYLARTTDLDQSTDHR
ncbi:MAG TPA: DUF4233 domain-containing protein [Lacisediminihabitans sp.]|uniref:DUF4233 domain-containing protein n=1 Tax=Lacisediminihabitans sp. TaxID=2787631 RepID=UPI002ED80EFA